MEENTTYHYVLFPLPLLQVVFKEPEEAISDLFHYGIYDLPSPWKSPRKTPLKRLFTVTSGIS
ncbi:MAG: hypothetical protein LIP05_08060 [Tannerellaceae bacterium]|nr:hypothetical protein [Tannerellaceae bacterium]